jgi:16S rRNA (guanine(1405)-N(7))-methyltransferase
MLDPATQLDQLVASVRKSAKYHSVCEELIRNIGARELGKRRALKEAIKATRNTLHQVCGAYQENGINYAAEMEKLRKAAQSSEKVDWRRACAALMSLHASTRERLPILDRFYETTLADLAPIRSVLDIACGLNPLAIPWMPLAPDAEYHAFDVCEAMTGFLNEFLALTGCEGRAHVADVTCSCPTKRADVALLLKSLPCLEQIDRAAGTRLLETINADHLLVSFPVASLGGKGKGRARHYEARFEELVAGKNWKVKRFEFSTELAFLVTR